MGTLTHAHPMSFVLPAHPAEGREGDEPQRQQHQHGGVRDLHGVEVDEGRRDERAGGDVENEGQSVGAESGVVAHKERARQRLHQRIAEGYAPATVAAFAAQDDVAHERDIVVGFDGSPATRTI